MLFIIKKGREIYVVEKVGCLEYEGRIVVGVYDLVCMERG